jgi:hypothetical protein
MLLCPKCNRNSLEFSEKRKTVWCLYVEDCGFEKHIENYDSFLEKFASLDVESDQHHVLPDGNEVAS